MVKISSVAFQNALTLMNDTNRPGQRPHVYCFPGLIHAVDNIKNTHKAQSNEDRTAAAGCATIVTCQHKRCART